MNKVANGVPSIRYDTTSSSCDNYTKGKFTTMIKGYNKHPLRATTQCAKYNMDYGFVRGKTTFKNEEGQLLTSKDGFNCYLLVAEEYTCYMLIFLFADKSPHMKTIKICLYIHGLAKGMRRIRSDQGGELAKSIEF